MSALHQQGRQTHPVTSLRRNRDFLLLTAGQVVSSVGTQVSMVAFPLLILAITHSPAQAGLLGALRSIPFVAFTLPAGAWLDRWDRKRTMVLSDAGRALALGSIPPALWFGHLSLVQLMVVALVEGMLFTFFSVAESASLPQVVSKEQAAHAVGVSGTIESVSMLIGPSISGLLYAVGRALPFLVDAVSYAGSVISLLFIRTEFQEERKEEQRHLLREIQDGLVWLWRQRVLRSLAVYIGILNLFSMGYPIVMIVRAQELHANAVAIGLLFATGGIGSIIGSLSVGWLHSRFRFGHIMLWAMWIWTVTWVPYAIAPTLLTFGIANAVGWVIVPVVIGSQFSYRMTVIPDALQARVGSVVKLLAFGPEPISLAMAGTMVQLFGPVTTIWVFVVPQFMVCIAATFDRPVRRVPRLRDVPHG